MDERLLLKPEEAAQRLGLSRATVYELIANARLESIQIGRSRRISVKALSDFVEAQRRVQSVTASGGGPAR